MSEPSPKALSVPLTFNLLPTEVKALVFKRLNIKAFVTCRQVSKQWKEIIDSLKDDVLWKGFLREIYSDKAEIYMNKTTMPIYKLFKNLNCWNDPVELQIMNYTDSVNFEGIRTAHVYKEYLIIVLASYVQYYTVYNFEEIDMEIEGSFQDFNENDYMYMALTDDGTLMLYGKPKVESRLMNTPHLKSVIPEVNIVKMIGNKLYYVIKESCIWVAKWNRVNWTHTFLAKHQTSCSINDICIDNNEMYIISSYFKVYRVIPEEKKVQYEYNTDLSYMAEGPYMFDRYTVGYGLRNIGNSVNITDDGYVTINQLRLSAVLEHGDTIITAHSCGLLDIFSKKSLRTLQRHEERQLSARPFLNDIKALDVYEGEDGHYLFLIASSNIIVYKIFLLSPHDGIPPPKISRGAHLYK